MSLSITSLMLTKKFRLTGKDINFLTKRKQVFYTNNFLFFYIKQYSQHSYHQFSFHIPYKLHKKSVVRHLLKRALVDYVLKYNLHTQAIGEFWYKFFIVINKNVFSQWQKQIENCDKKHIITFVQSEFEKSRKILNLKLK